MTRRSNSCSRTFYWLLLQSIDVQPDIRKISNTPRGTKTKVNHNSIKRTILHQPFPNAEGIWHNRSFLKSFLDISQDRMKLMKVLFVMTAALAAISSIQALQAGAEETAATTEETVDNVTLDLDGASDSEEGAASTAEPAAPVQSGPLVDLLGPTLLSLEMIDETSAQLQPHYTTDALRGKNVIGLYFSADW